MDKAERAAVRHSNDALREQVDGMLETLQRQQENFAELQQQIAATTGAAWSRDKLVHVTVNAAGVVSKVHIAQDAFKKATPETLSASMAEAAQAAAASAQQKGQQLLAPMVAEAEGLTDVSDLIPGAPSIREMMQSFMPQPVSVPTTKPSSAAPAPAQWDDDEDEDDALPDSWMDRR